MITTCYIFTDDDGEIEHLIDENDERVGELWVKDLPMSWEFAKGCFFAGEMKGYRSKNLEKEYERVRDENNLVWKDIESQIKCEVFEMPKEIEEIISK